MINVPLEAGLAHCSIRIMSTILIEIRRARPADAKSVAAAHDDAWRNAYQGVIPGPELERLKLAYFAAWPDGPSRAAWPGLTYVRIRPTWIRYSDFNSAPPIIQEFTARDLANAIDRLGNFLASYRQ